MNMYRAYAFVQPEWLVAAAALAAAATAAAVCGRRCLIIVDSPGFQGFQASRFATCSCAQTLVYFSSLG